MSNVGSAHVHLHCGSPAGVSIEDEEIGDRSVATSHGLQNILTKHSSNNGTDRRELMTGGCGQGSKKIEEC